MTTDCDPVTGESSRQSGLDDIGKQVQVRKPAMLGEGHVVRGPRA